MKRFTQKTVLVTGGSRGIGAAIVKRFATEGANVVINYTAKQDKAEHLAAECANLGVKAVIYKANVGNEKEVQKLIDFTVNEFGSIDILVNNAGIVFDVPFLEKTTDQWQETLNVNLNGTYYCTKLSLPHIKKGGCIINISSTNGIDTYHADSVDYDVSKAGIIMFTKSIAGEIAKNGIRINCIAPGWFNTDMNTDLPADYIAGENAQIALGRFGQPEEIAGVASFLASEDASYMTGSIVVVDGGYGSAV